MRPATKLSMWLLLAMLCLTAAMLLGCSPSITQWADRGLEGLRLEERNVAQWYGIAITELDKQKLAQIDAAYQDTKMMVAGQIKGPDGKPIPLDAVWLDEQRVALKIGLSAVEDRATTYAAQYEITKQNIASSAECFERIKSLNAAWIGSNEQMALQLNRLTQAVLDLQQKGK